MQSAGSVIPESKIKISPGTRDFSSMATSSDMRLLRRRRTRTSAVTPDCNLMAARLVDGGMAAESIKPSVGNGAVVSTLDNTRRTAHD